MTDRISWQLRQQVQQVQQKPANNTVQPQKPAAGSFGQVMQQELAVKNAAVQQSALPKTQGVAFSKHASLRAAERGIELTPDLMAQLAGSIERAQAKGATNILAMDTANVYIINVPNARVITAITQAEMKENVFTNIDGAVFL